MQNNRNAEKRACPEYMKVFASTVQRRRHVTSVNMGTGSRNSFARFSFLLSTGLSFSESWGLNLDFLTFF